MAFAHYTPSHKILSYVLFPIRSTTWCVITNSISNALRRAADAVGNDALRCAATPLVAIGIARLDTASHRPIMHSM